jgi:hypothetical protein
MIQAEARNVIARSPPNGGTTKQSLFSLSEDVIILANRPNNLRDDNILQEQDLIYF